MRAKNIKNIKLNLENNNPFPKGLYKTFESYFIHEKIESTISSSLNEIVTKKILPLLEGRYLVKYLICDKQCFNTPFFTFELKKSIEVLLSNIHKEYDEKNLRIFSIRIDFIDPDSNLKSFIIILD